MSRFTQFREKILDLWMLASVLFSISLGISMILVCSISLRISSPIPYLLFFLLIFLGINGFRYYRKEVEL